VILQLLSHLLFSLQLNSLNDHLLVILKLLLLLLIKLVFQVAEIFLFIKLVHYGLGEEALLLLFKFLQLRLVLFFELFLLLL